MITTKDRIQSAFDAAKDGESVDGYIDCRGAYIAYETTTVNDTRYFKLEVASDAARFGDACSRSTEYTGEFALRVAQSLALQILPGVSQKPDTDHLFAVVNLENR